MKRSLAALGNNKYFEKLAITPTKQAGVTDALRKAKSYIREGKEQIRQGKEVLRTGRIPGSARVYSKDMYTKWAKDKIRLGKANKLTGTIIYRKLKMRGLDIGRFAWSGKPWSAYYKGQKITISKEGINKAPKERGSRDQSWGKIVTRSPIMRSSIPRNLSNLGKNKFFKQLSRTTANKARTNDELNRVKFYIKEGKAQISAGKKALRTGKIPGTDKKYSREVIEKWAKDKIRLGKATKLTGEVIYRKLYARGFLRHKPWTGKSYTLALEGDIITTQRGGDIKKQAKYSYYTKGRDQGWGKISSKPSLGKLSFGEGLSRGLIRYKTQKLKRGKGIFGRGSRGTMMGG